MTAFGRMRTMRVNPIQTWGRRAYEEDIIQGRFVGRSSFILNTPDAIRHVLVDNYENYTRTPAGMRVLRPMLGEGVLTAEGRAWKHQRRTLAPAFTPRAVTTLIPHMVAATDETIARLRAASNAPVDLREVMQQMTLEIAAAPGSRSEWTGMGLLARFRHGVWRAAGAAALPPSAAAAGWPSRRILPAPVSASAGPHLSRCRRRNAVPPARTRAHRRVTCST